MESRQELLRWLEMVRLGCDVLQTLLDPEAVRPRDAMTRQGLTEQALLQIQAAGQALGQARPAIVREVDRLVEEDRAQAPIPIGPTDRIGSTPS